MRVRTLLTTAVVTVTALAGAAATTVANAATGPLCEQFGSTHQGNYVVMNNKWNPAAGGQQCIDVTSNGFRIAQQPNSVATNGGPASYPAIYVGCHYTNCSDNSPLPKQLSSIGSITSSISYDYAGSGTYDAAYDIWLDSTAKKDGVNQTEIMIWFNHVGPIQPIGSPTGNATIGGRGWQVWTGSNGQNNVVSYLADSAIGSWNFNTLDFIRDSLTRGSQYGTMSWYLTSVQAGFEPWSGGAGLAITSFNVSVDGGTPPNNPPASNPPPATTPPVGNPPGNGNCTASYHVASSWPNGFQGEITVKNTGSAPISHWTAAWSFGGGQQVSQFWNATVRSAGSGFTAMPMDYNSTIAPGATTSFGFIGSGDGGSANPTCSAG